jgi:hypothetical protein
VCFGSKKRKSAAHVQRHSRTQFAKIPSTRPLIYKWHWSFVATGCCVSHTKKSGRTQVSEETVYHVRRNFVRSLSISARRESRELDIPQDTVRNVLTKRLDLKRYKMQIL